MFVVVLSMSTYFSSYTIILISIGIFKPLVVISIFMLSLIPKIFCYVVVLMSVLQQTIFVHLNARDHELFKLCIKAF